MPLRLICNATGEDFPPDEIQWFFNGEKLQSDSRKNLRITDEVNLSTHTLISTLEIKYASMSDTGNYVCRSSARLTTGVRVEVLNGTPSLHGSRGGGRTGTLGAPMCICYLPHFMFLSLALCLSN